MHSTKRSVVAQLSTTDIHTREDSHFQNPDTIVLLVSLGSREDQEIDSVISNVGFLRGSMHASRDKDVVAVYPFPDSKTKTLTQSRNPAEQDETMQDILDSFSSSMPHAQEGSHEYKRCIVGLIGSRYTTESDDYFGAVSAERFPALLGKLASIIDKSSLTNVAKVEFKLYCCNAQIKVDDLEDRIRDELETFTKTGRKVVLKATHDKVVGNPLYQNIAMGLDPKYNKHKQKYLSGKNIPPEHKISSEEASHLPHVSNRVFARVTPISFSMTKIKNKEQLLTMASRFAERKNNWTTMTL